MIDTRHPVDRVIDYVQDNRRKIKKVAATTTAVTGMVVAAFCAGQMSNNA